MAADDLSIKFDVERARAEAAARNLSEAEWAERAGVARQTLIAFLARSPRIRMQSVEAILKPLDLRAIDIQIIPADVKTQSSPVAMEAAE